MSEDYRRKLAAPARLAERPGTEGKGEAARLAADRIRARHQALLPVGAVTSGDPLLNLRIRLDRTCDRDRPCCDTPNIGVITAPVGPHGPGIRCAGCGNHRGWLKRAASTRLTELLARGLLGLLLPSLKDDTILRGAMPVHPDAGGGARPEAL